jgi:hypothetical protein
MGPDCLLTLTGACTIFFSREQDRPTRVGGGLTVMYAVPLPRTRRTGGPGVVVCLGLCGSPSPAGAVLFSGGLAQARQPGSSTAWGRQRIESTLVNTLTLTRGGARLQPRRPASDPAHCLLYPLNARVPPPQRAPANMGRADSRRTAIVPPRFGRRLQRPQLIHPGARPPPLPIRPGVRAQRASPILNPTLKERGFSRKALPEGTFTRGGRRQR